MSRKKSGSYTHTSYNTTRINGRRRYLNKTTTKIDIDSKGNKTTTINSSNIDIDKRINLFSSLFKFSLVLIFGSMFFSNGVNGFNSVKTDSNTKTEYITNNINGTNYEYRVHSSNYDYTTKLNQLQGLRNVFDLNVIEEEEKNELSLLRVPNPEFFMNGGKYQDDADIVGEMVYYNVISLVYDSFEVDNQTYSYYYMRLNSLSVPEEYSLTFNSYVNSNNVISWVTYQKSILGEDEQWYDDLVKAIKLLNAPIIWTSNLCYDIGVIINFLVNW